MSPTNHSASSTTNITLGNLTMNTHILKQTASKNPIDPSSFSCLSKPSSDSYSENKNIVYRHRENNNWASRVYPKENGTEILSNGSRVGSLEDDYDSQDNAQIKEDLHYLGEDGYSRWGGESTKGGWVRKMGYAERFMTGSTDFGVMSTVYNLWFESKAKVELNTIEKACYMVARKLPHLRLSVGKRDGDLWWREMETLNLDIKELETDNVLNTFEVLLKKRFDLENGPLWFVRYIKLNEDDRWKNKFPMFTATQSDPEVKHKFIVIFGFHHNFTDGTTNMKFCNVFLKVLNDLMLNAEVDMKVEAKLVEAHHDRIADKDRYSSIIKNNAWLLYVFCHRFFKGILSYGMFIRNYTYYYNQPCDQEATTRIIPGELDEETTARLLRKCKEEKATLNSVFTAASNIALYKMVLTHNSTLKSTSFGGIHTINMRRYWTEEQSKDSCGCHISTIDVQIPTDINDITNFWNYARKVQNIMKYELNEGKRCIKLMPIGEKLRIILYMNSFLEYMSCPSTNDNHYLITNMGNLEKLFTGKGEVVEVSRLMRSISCHYMPNLCQHTLHTFRGRLFYSLDYYTQKMERDHALLYAKTLTETLKEISLSPLSQL